MNKLKDFFKKYQKWFLIILFLCIFVLIAIYKDTLEAFDSSVYNVIKIFINPYMTFFFKFITKMTEIIALIGGTAIIALVLLKKKRYAIITIINLFNTVLLNIILKNIFLRERPYDLMLISEEGYSFPSGHAMTSMSFYGFLIYLVWHYNCQKKTKITVTLFLSLLIFLIGISRIYLGVHYATDVLAGFSLSSVYLIIFTTFTSKYIKGWISNE